jgi:hypothetical protein
MRTGMKLSKTLFLFTVVLISAACVPVEKMARHDFTSGYYKLKTEGNEPSRVYTDVINDSVIVYPVIKEGKNEKPDISALRGIGIKNVTTGTYFYKSCFIKNSIDVDLTTLVLKYRPPVSGVPGQLNYNLNAAIYMGFRRDFYKVVPYKSPLKDEISFIRQIGFDAGIFADIGSSFMNPTNTDNRITQEYDGLILQKGFAGFITFDNISVGLALGFDNLLDHNKTLWIYNQKPYLGLVIGISNF